MSFRGLLKTFDRKRCFEEENWERERWNIIAFIHFSELGEREASLEGDLPYQCSIKFPMKLSTRPHCVLHYLLYSVISAPLCALQNNPQLKYTRISSDKRNTISMIFAHEAPEWKKYLFDFNVLIDGHQRAKEKWSDSEALKLWSAFVWQYNLSALTKWPIV